MIVNQLRVKLLVIVVVATDVAMAVGANPNIVFILADDLGYGDVSCLNHDGKVRTPKIDLLAGDGMVFTDAHSGSAVCTPTRYGILTGRYAWRSRLKQGVLNGISQRLIEADRLTVATLLKQKGYATACIGKWHLGMDWQSLDGGLAKSSDEVEPNGDLKRIDYSKPIRNGPTAVGFDFFFGISASLDIPPFVWIKNDRCVGAPTVEKTFLRKGPATPDFEAIDVLPRITQQAVAYITDRAAAAKKGQPFFLYLALTAPHTPIVPAMQWKGKSQLNEYGDFVMQVDDTVGKVLDALDQNRLASETLVIFTSDNGCSNRADFETLTARGHRPSHVFRGMKADIFEGGHRIPLVVRWPAKVPSGSTCDQTVCLTDFMATAAEIVHTELPQDAAEDSVGLLLALMDPHLQHSLREAIVHHSINGSFAIRQGKWKLILCPDSGGWSNPKPGSSESQALPAVQLYDLSIDVAEQSNVQDQHPQVVENLSRLLSSYQASGRSTRTHPSTTTLCVLPSAARQLFEGNADGL